MCRIRTSPSKNKPNGKCVQYKLYTVTLLQVIGHVRYLVLVNTNHKASVWLIHCNESITCHSFIYVCIFCDTYRYVFINVRLIILEKTTRPKLYSYTSMVLIFVFLFLWVGVSYDIQSFLSVFRFLFKILNSFRVWSSMSTPPNQTPIEITVSINTSYTCRLILVLILTVNECN